MPQRGMLKLDDTVTAWADIVLKIWSDRIIDLKVYDTGELLRSLKYEMLRNAGGDPERIDFSFKFYGIFQDFGTEWDMRRIWYSGPFYVQVMRLKEIITEKYIGSMKINISSHMTPVKN